MDPGTIRRLPKGVLPVAAALGAFALVYLARTRPGYFTSQVYLGGLILLELLIAAIWKFRQVFFPLLIAAFLLAGASLPGASVWTSARWVFLGVGAGVGFLMFVKDGEHHFDSFHVIALFAAMVAVVSGIVSRYPTLTLLKALSLFLLFLYASSGARLAAQGRETRFFARLLLGCELVAGIFVVSYLGLGSDLMGNPNSLGAIVGVVLGPVLCWGIFVSEDTLVRRRRLVLFVLCMYLVFHSHSRASMVAAVLSCGMLCVGLRRYRALIAGVVIASIVLTTAAILRPEVFLEKASTVTSDVVYKGFQQEGVFQSRQSPWRDAVDTIRSHFWFGTGFGTTDTGTDASAHLGKFSSSFDVTKEYGSSYLEIATWVGMLGILPFLLLLLTLAAKVARTFSWMWNTRNPVHFAIPLAAVVFAGLVHAAFEDWMFAPGYYLCVFFWCAAFLLADFAPVIPGVSKPTVPGNFPECRPTIGST